MEFAGGITDLAICKGQPHITTQPTDVVICPGSNATLSVVATGQAALSYQWQVDAGGGFANINNGGVYSGATTNALSITGAGCSMDGYHYRCVVTDGGGNSVNSNSALLTTADTTAPVFTQPGDTAISCDASALPANTGTIAAADMSDNCAPDANLTVTSSDVSTQSVDASLLAHYNYTITRTWEVRDVAGNATQHDQVITVSDTTSPVFTQPGDTAISCDASALPANTGTIAAADMSDNCAPDANLTVTSSDVSTQSVDASLLAHYNYTITRTWEVRDVAGNATQHDQVITVSDTTSPVFTQPGDTAISCDASALPANTGTIAAADMSDNCAPDANLTVTSSDVSTQSVDASLLAHYNYTITRTWEVRDVAGNATQHDQVITVSDTTSPVFTQPGDTAISCDASALPANTGDHSSSRHVRQLCPGCKSYGNLQRCEHAEYRCLAAGAL